jgi:flagellar basal body rod protein FlgG
MIYGLYISASGADMQSRRMEVLSHNMANVDTTGFKEELAVIQARDSRAIQDGLDTTGRGGLNDLGSGTSLVETVTNWADGAYKETGNVLDLAIHGEGFFVVEKDGEQYLTRAGDFQVGEDGRLITQQGYAVLADGGSPMQIDPRMPPEIDEQGFVTHLGGRDLLSVVKPKSLGDLARVGENLFQSLSAVETIDPADRNIASGYLETSGVRTTSTMMELIETSRMYEANVRMIQNQDQTASSLINRILKVR